jgi:uncharacterized protein (TIGR00730 family)
MPRGGTRAGHGGGDAGGRGAVTQDGGGHEAAADVAEAHAADANRGPEAAIEGGCACTVHCPEGTAPTVRGPSQPGGHPGGGGRIRVRPMEPLRRIAVYCASSDGADPAYRDAATAMGACLGRRGIGLVYGGGALGLMGAVADAALAAVGEVTGVIPAFMDGREHIHRGVTHLRVSRSMHDRKATMLDLADAVIALPGGLGTLDELVEAITWTQLGLHDIPCGVLDVGGYWAPFFGLIDHYIAEGFVVPERRLTLARADDPDRLIDVLAERVPDRVASPRASDPG